MNSMFKGVASVKSMDLSKFETTTVKDMAKMFLDCKELISLDISNFNLTNIGSNPRQNLLPEVKHLEQEVVVVGKTDKVMEY